MLFTSVSTCNLQDLSMEDWETVHAWLKSKLIHASIPDFGSLFLVVEAGKE